MKIEGTTFDTITIDGNRAHAQHRASSRSVTACWVGQLGNLRIWRTRHVGAGLRRNHSQKPGSEYLAVVIPVMTRCSGTCSTPVSREARN